MKIALGTTRASKIDALRAAIMRIGEINSGWRGAEIIPLAAQTNSPAMPLTDEELMQGAKLRAEAVRKLLEQENKPVHLYVGLEGGFQTIELENRTYTPSELYPVNESNEDTEIKFEPVRWSDFFEHNFEMVQLVSYKGKERKVRLAPVTERLKVGLLELWKVLKKKRKILMTASSLPLLIKQRGKQCVRN